MSFHFHSLAMLILCAGTILDTPAWAQLPLMPSQVQIDSVPAGAQVTVDGQSRDATPLTMTNLPPGTHLVVVRKEGYNLERRTIVTAPGQKQIFDDFKLTPITGLLLIHSTPRDAEVQVNGVFKGRTPLIMTDLPLGNHRMQVSAIGFTPKDLDLKVENRIPKRLDVSLASNSGVLTIGSTPAAASVTINGVSVGTTPLYLDRVNAGRKQIEIAREGYVPYSQELLIESGTSNTIAANLIAIPGKLTILVTPMPARLYINDQPRGTAPLIITNMTPGTYTIRAEARGHESISKPAEVRNGAGTTVEFTLVRNSGMLELITEPAGVQVFVDGEDCGTTPAGTTDLISNPFKVDLLARGIHRLQLTRKGYFSLEKSFNIESDKTVTIQETLKKRFIADTRVQFQNEDGTLDAKNGAISQRLPNGDIELETKPGIFMKIPANQVILIEPVTAP